MQGLATNHLKKMSLWASRAARPEASSLVPDQLRPRRRQFHRATCVTKGRPDHEPIPDSAPHTGTTAIRRLAMRLGCYENLSRRRTHPCRSKVMIMAISHYF